MTKKRLSLAEMRANIEAKKPSGGNSQFWTPMDNLDFGQSATVRLLPWYDDVSGGFWTEQKTLKATFTNPDNDAEKWLVHIPCLEQYSNDTKCPVADEVRVLFKESEELKEVDPTESKNLRAIASDHWIKRNLLYQGFVLKGGNKPVDENAIVPIRATKQVHDVISVVFDPEAGFEKLPTGEFDMDDIAVLNDGGDIDLGIFEGRSIIMRKTKKTEGTRDFADYTTSSWSQGAGHQLNADQIEYIAKNGLIDLRKFLPKQPTEEQYAIYAEIMKVSLNAAITGDDAPWNKEWEEFGITPFKPKSKDGENKEENGGDLRSKLKARLNKEDITPKDDTAKTNLRERLNNRGAASAASESEPEVEPASEEQEVKEAAPSKPMSLAERLKAAKAKSAGN